MLTPTSTVVILGFGTRAEIFAALLTPRGCALRAWDPLLTMADAATPRMRIEAAGVDAITELPDALRGARLVVLDTVPMTDTLRQQLQVGQHLLDLANDSDADIDAALTALGLPTQSAPWHATHAARASTVANSQAADIPMIRRGELP